jgi:hypothetical protein
MHLRDFWCASDLFRPETSLLGRPVGARSSHRLPL